MKDSRAARTLLLAGLAALGLVFGLTRAEQVHRNGFETREVAWVKGTADAVNRETTHEVTDATAHSGQYSEHIQLSAEQGSQINYYYSTGRAPISEELSVSVWVKANRPGIQLAARVVLPKERNPNNLDEPLSTILVSDQYQTVSRWQRLELRRPSKLTRERQQLMRAELNRDADFTDAYVDRIILNLYSGPGLTEVWIDDLEIGPVTENTPFQTTSRPTATPGKAEGSMPRPPSRAAVVEFKDLIYVNGKRFFFRGIRHSDTPLKALRDAGFNTVWFDFNTPSSLMEEAINLGFWIVPSVPVGSQDPRLASSNSLVREVARFTERDAVLFWDLGGGLSQEQAPLVARTGKWIQAADPQRPQGGDVWDGFQPYSRTLDLVGAHRWPLMTNLELPRYQAWLEQRRLLSRPGTFMWTWVQTHLPDWYTQLVYDRPGSAGFDEPVGPQPEQIRLLTWITLAAGARGLGFWSDRFLADSHQGRDRLLQLALLNQELRLLEPMLVSAGSPSWIDTSHGDVKAAVFRTEHGVLVLPMWLGRGAQFVPGQAATANLKMTIPQVPIGVQAWEISPVGVRSLLPERVAGGTKVEVPEFGLTTALLLTPDIGAESIIVRLQDQTRQMRKQAAQWAHDLAAAELEKVVLVQTKLQEMKRAEPDANQLMENARQRLKTCAERFNSGDYREAYEEANRVLRPLRILMRGQWTAALKGYDKQPFDTPTATPYLLSYFTLPRQWQFANQLQQGTVSTNLLPSGDFEQRVDQTLEGWAPQTAILDDVEPEARREPDAGREGKQGLMLRLKPRAGTLIPPAALERTYLAINSPLVRATPGTLVRISAWIMVPDPIKASPDGALFFDSIGGEPMAVRIPGKADWKRYHLYRQVPASGEVSVTLALTGLGTVYFDDVRIEPIVPGPSTNPRATP